MWQRVQTLYLVLSALATALMFFMDKATIAESGRGVGFVQYLPYLILLIIISLLDLIALASSKFRVFQLRTAALSAIFSLSLQVWIALDFFCTRDVAVFHVAAVFPVASIILDILAIRGIWADELLVRSSSRLRSAKRTIKR